MKFLHTFLLMPLLSMAFVFASQKISAQEIPPSNWNDRVVGTFEKDAAKEVVIWNKKLAAQDADGTTNNWQRNYWVCYSDTDDNYGACATKGRWGAVGLSSVKLRFTEARSKASHTLELTGSKVMSHNNEGKREAASRALHGASSTYERTTDPVSVSIDVRLPASELKKLPAGGIWKAHLKLRQMQWGTYQQVAETNAEITLHVTDTKNVQIFLPEYNTTTPTVDLGLVGQVSRAGRTTGRRNIDMCLYDGFGSNSSWFDVTVKDDQSVPQRALGSFSVIRDGTSGQTPRERIDYGVTYLHNGQRTSLNNGEMVRLPGGNNTEVRPVYLPNIPVPVLCKPMPLTLETPEFNAKDKLAGSYTGKLRIIFSPSAQSL
ncbi:CfaE/CblD family pilus tip adhesin [Burkholderia gladioli]|uniref:CfaE/CblD family pilus tip adhesin n=1 Tax=Burkholderia gladioli TaxID=28095 RepID=UPI003B97F371